MAQALLPVETRYDNAAQINPTGNQIPAKLRSAPLSAFLFSIFDVRGIALPCDYPVELHRRGLPEKEIARRLPGSDLLWRLWTGGHFSKRNLVRAFLRPKNEPWHR